MTASKLKNMSSVNKKNILMTKPKSKMIINIFPPPSKRQCVTVKNKKRFPKKKKEPKKVYNFIVISTAKDLLGKLISHFTDREEYGSCKWVK